MEAVALAALGLVTSILTLVVKPLFGLLKANTQAQKEQTKAMLKIANTNEKIAEKTERVAASSEKNGRESAERNGHLGELILKQSDQTQLIANKAVEAILKSNQHVGTQEVDEQIIKKQSGTIKPDKQMEA